MMDIIDILFWFDFHIVFRYSLFLFFPLVLTTRDLSIYLSIYNLHICSGHLTGRHNITMTEYFEKYEKNKLEPPVIAPPPLGESSYCGWFLEHLYN